MGSEVVGRRGAAEVGSRVIGTSLPGTYMGYLVGVGGVPIVVGACVAVGTTLFSGVGVSVMACFGPGVNVVGEEVGSGVCSSVGGTVVEIGIRVLGTYVEYVLGVGVGSISLAGGVTVGATVISGVGFAVKTGAGPDVDVVGDEIAGGVGRSVG